MAGEIIDVETPGWNATLKTLFSEKGVDEDGQKKVFAALNKDKLDAPTQRPGETQPLFERRKAQGLPSFHAYSPPGL